ncbi:hypothetical protein Agub_g15483 [Astrephomene gubernaculifera]|uniref:PPM-type phosphatase domain-containing protein n=1 Tax=Astrephomene gubernaculifera TaxID=47775 RepID=A0AAD3E354_9CHLO|nr:hypothetical protein Agub_g15483 [Astrephomene gubernaculifera]
MMGQQEKSHLGHGLLAMEEPYVGAYVMPHPTRPNEDAFCVCPLQLSTLDRALFCGVYDGHNGSEVSHFLAGFFPHYVAACCQDPLKLAASLEVAFQAADSALADTVANCPGAGSTATVALLSSTEITVANCGDSRALLCRGCQVISLTEDHRPARSDERARILRAGGQILWNEGERLMGVLATTRGFGDLDLQQFGLTSQPEITTTQRSPDDQLLILATDGVFNVLSNQEVADVATRVLARAAQRGLPRAAAVRLASSAIARFSRDRNSKDDITVLVVDLAPATAAAEAATAEAAGATKNDSHRLCPRAPAVGGPFGRCMGERVMVTQPAGCGAAHLQPAAAQSGGAAAAAAPPQRLASWPPQQQPQSAAAAAAAQAPCAPGAQELVRGIPDAAAVTRSASTGAPVAAFGDFCGSVAPAEPWASHTLAAAAAAAGLLRSPSAALLPPSSLRPPPSWTQLPAATRLAAPGGGNSPSGPAPTPAPAPLPASPMPTAFRTPFQMPVAAGGCSSASSDRGGACSASSSSSTTVTMFGAAVPALTHKL